MRHVEQNGAAAFALRNVRVFDLGVHAVQLVGLQSREFLFDAHTAFAILGELLDLDAASAVHAITLGHLDGDLAAVVEVNARPACQSIFERTVRNLHGIGVHPRTGRLGRRFTALVAAARPQERCRHQG